MGVRFHRMADIAPGRREEAIAFAAEVSAYVTENWGTKVTWGVEVGGRLGRIHWFSDHESMAEVEANLAKSMADDKYVAIIDKAEGLFLPEVEDTIIYTM